MVNTKAIAKMLFNRKADRVQRNLYLDNINATLQEKREIVAEYTRLVHEAINNWAEC